MKALKKLKSQSIEKELIKIETSIIYDFKKKNSFKKI